MKCLLLCLICPIIRHIATLVTSLTQDDSTDREVTIPVGFLLGRNGQVIRNTLHKLRLDEAVINVPINLTNVATHKWKQPPWVVW